MLTSEGIRTVVCGRLALRLIELKILGYPISPEAEGKIRKGHDDRVNRKRKAKLKREELRHSTVSLGDENWPGFEFIAGYTSAGFPFGIRFEDNHAPYVTYIDEDEGQENESEEDESKALPPKEDNDGDLVDLPL